ncbi:MAG: ComF family protein [Clostridia bacterium]|nr:ComF family protein [Clostridia bacterium]
MKMVKNFLNLLLSAIYPNKCVCCGKIINDDYYICDHCDKLIERNNIDNICLNCGFQEQDCVCKYNVYRFNSIICVFRNEVYARDAYYAYKFSKKQHYANFFAQEMCEAIQKVYSGIEFDVICAVPSFNKLKYDHSGYIAQLISKELNVPYTKCLLTCIKRSKKQHKSTIQERLCNVDGKYKVNHRVDNLKILLVDDIKTTGATLDECAKELLFAGAKSVYCVTALGSSNSQKQKIEK